MLDKIRDLIVHVGEDPERDGLKDTPSRFLKAFDFWTQGYKEDTKDLLKSFDTVGHDAFVFQASIPFYSLCEHHLAPFFGIAHIGYIPQGRVVGLSKLSRLIDVFARRLQVQERLCSQVADSLMNDFKPTPEGVGVVMQCRHMCMESRGIQRPGTVTITSSLRGSIKTDPTVRAEFMSLVQTAVSGVRGI